MMATQTLPADDRAVSAAEFARLRGVHRSQVTRYVKDGKISGDALVPSGRGVKIRVKLAMAQLRERLDIGQQIGNGIDARTSLEGEQSEGARSEGALFADVREVPGCRAAAGRGPSIEEQIKRERLRSVQFANRKAAEEEEARKGRLMETDAAQARMTGLVSQTLQAFEGGLADMATAIGERFELPQRDVLHLLKGEFRKVCASAAERARKRLAETPATVETVVRGEGEDAS
ncbi:hypothetical protein [Stappia sp.]|uniref:hypothetical protein n=1 Tax=Stappia sp. TaxID=1870903 RepID=UPI000C993AC9|nr:hypothetical protein [Stappia sp.]MAA99708.1 hypothetical protein [Stappia sp.]